MIYETEYGNINIREIGTPVLLPGGAPGGWNYNHTVQVSFKGKRAQFKVPSEDTLGEKLYSDELLEALRYFIFTGIYADEGYEQFCILKWGIEPEVSRTAAGRKEYFGDYERTDRRRVQLERMGITSEMALSIDCGLDFAITRERRKNR